MTKGDRQVYPRGGVITGPEVLTRTGVGHLPDTCTCGLGGLTGCEGLVRAGRTRVGAHPRGYFTESLVDVV